MNTNALTHIMTWQLKHRRHLAVQIGRQVTNIVLTNQKPRNIQARDSQPCSKMNLSLWKLHVQKVGFLSIQTPGIKGLPIGCIYRDYKDHTGVRFAKRHVLFIVRNVDLWELGHWESPSFLSFNSQWCGPLPMLRAPVAKLSLNCQT